MLTSYKFLIALLGLCLSQLCFGAIWKTEDAYIIDDQPDNDNELPTNEAHSVCEDSAGSKGQCVPVQDCYQFYDFFSQSNRTIEVGIFNEYLNIKAEPCTPPVNARERRDDELKYVCCTSLRYANVKSISLSDYLKKEVDSDNVTIPEIPVADASTADTSKIVNPAPAGVGEFPFAVALLVNGQQFCGGSLIDSRWVLSAAHCFDKFKSATVRQLIVKIGDHNIHSTSDANHQDVAVQKLYLHPGFFRGPKYFRDDVALVKLKSPVARVGFAKTISLHNGSPNINSQTLEAVVCGWGKTCQNCQTSPVINKAILPIVQNQRCQKLYGPTAAPQITEKMVCAGGSGSSDACQGDSGGPLVIYDRGSVMQIGIVSWGIGCGQYPGVYTRVSSYVNWIARHKQRGSL